MLTNLNITEKSERHIAARAKKKSRSIFASAISRFTEFKFFANGFRYSATMESRNKNIIKIEKL